MSEDYKELLQKYELLAKQYENLKTQYLTVLDLAKKTVTLMSIVYQF